MYGLSKADWKRLQKQHKNNLKLINYYDVENVKREDIEKMPLITLRTSKVEKTVCKIRGETGKEIGIYSPWDETYLFDGGIVVLPNNIHPVNMPSIEEVYLGLRPEDLPTLILYHTSLKGLENLADSFNLPFDEKAVYLNKILAVFKEREL